MKELRIIDLVLIIIFLIIGIETIIKFKHSEGKLIDDIKKPLMVRIDIIMILTILIAIVTIINIVLSIH